MKGNRVVRRFVVVLCVALWCMLLAGPVAGRAAAASMPVKQSVLAGSYRLELQIGPLEKMWTAAQVQKLHPKTGEVMISGTMAMGGMQSKAAMPNHHLELHIYNRTTGKTVTKAMVSITVLTTQGKVLLHLPIAEMRGVTQGASDTHFGNNVALKNGRYRIDVQVEMTKASFMVTLGGGMSM